MTGGELMGETVGQVVSWLNCMRDGLMGLYVGRMMGIWDCMWNGWCRSVCGTGCGLMGLYVGRVVGK